MTSFLLLILLMLLQFITGMGILSLFRISLRPLMQISLSILLGIAFFSIVPFALQLFYVPLTKTNIFLVLVLGAVALNGNYKYSLKSYRDVIKDFKIKIKLYEIPFLLLITFFVIVSIWRCFYLPPTPRDLIAGPEVIAEYAVKEKTMINSVFTVNLETTNNQFKPAYITSLQIIYKYIGFRFGQIWLSIMFISFILFLYHALSQKIHRVITGFLICAFIAIPEIYAYTVMALFDFSNVVYFFLSFYFLFRFFENNSFRYFLFSSLLLAISTYIRSETLILGFLVLPVIIVHFIKTKKPMMKLLIALISFIVPAAFFYWVSVPFYIGHYLPAKYDVGNAVNKNLTDLGSLWERFKLLNTGLLFSIKGIAYYGYFIYLFFAVFLLELLLRRKLTMQGKNWLAAILIVYFGLAFLGWLLPLFDLDNTTRRGMLKIFPMMLLFFSGSQLLINLSNKISAWESARIRTAVKT